MIWSPLQNHNMAWIFNPFTGKLDNTFTTAEGDVRYLKLDASNDPITGTLLLQNSADAQELIVKAKSGQTANLQEWQDSSGIPLGSVNSTGMLYLNMPASSSIPLIRFGNNSRFYMDDDPTRLTYQTSTYPYTSWTSIATMEAAGMQLLTGFMKFSSGTSLQFSNGQANYVHQLRTNVSNEIFEFNAGFVNYPPSFPTKIWDIYTDKNTATNRLFDLSIPLKIQGDTTSIVTETIKAFTGQTANLTEWQDSSSGVLANITPTGGAFISDKLAFTQTDLNEYIDSLADGYLDYRATTGHRFGDGTNQTVFGSDGKQSMAGTARVQKETRVFSYHTELGASAPTMTTRAVGASGGVLQPVLQFSKTTQNDVYFLFHAPEDMDYTSPAIFHLMWQPGAGWTTGNYMWKLEYLIMNGSGATLLAGTPTTISADVTPSNATTNIETAFSGNITLAVDQIMVCHFYRDVANDNGDDIGSTVAFELHYTSDKLGE